MYVVTLPKTAEDDPESFAQRAKLAGADLLEIRGDLTPDVSRFENPLPLIVSPRGETSLLNQHEPQYVDVGLNEELAVPESSTIIRSYHNTEETPALDALKEITKKLSKKGDIVKIVTTVQSYEDLRCLEELQASLPPEQPRIILGMGIKSHFNRILSPFRNTLTYTYLDEEDPVVAGQISLSIYRATAHCKNPRVYGIIGNLHVANSSSVRIQNALFASHGIDALFTTFPTETLEDAFDFVRDQDVRGLSVTSPFKQDVIPKLDTVDPLAGELQSVNTLVNEKGHYKGYNVDELGIRDGYDFFHPSATVAIVGSGGVVPSVIHALRKKGITDISLYARNEAARTSIGERMNVNTFDLEKMQEMQPDLLICAVHPDVSLPIPSPKKHAIAFDLRTDTCFLKEAKERGYRTYDGTPMLLHQALAQFQLFTTASTDDTDLQLLQDLFPSDHGKQ